MKVGLSSDFGTPEHWRRLVDFAKEHGVSQLVYWAVGSGCYAGRPFLFPKYPGLLGEEERQNILAMRENLRQAAAMCHEAGVGFAYPFAMGMPSLHIPYHSGTLGPSYRAIGPAALIEEKRQALADAEELLARARPAVANLKADAQRFILQKFEDFAFFARAAYAVLEAEVHYFHMCTNKTNPGFPDAKRLNALIPVLVDLAARWDKRQPHDEYHISRRLRAWHKELIKSLDERGLLA